jgi:hypothetical protein
MKIILKTVSWCSKHHNYDDILWLLLFLLLQGGHKATLALRPFFYQECVPHMSSNHSLTRALGQLPTNTSSSQPEVRNGCQIIINTINFNAFYTLCSNRLSKAGCI